MYVMRNAKEELIEAVWQKKVICAKLWNDQMEMNKGYTEEAEKLEGEKYYILKKDYTDKELFEFLSSIDYTYDAWYWGKELYWLVRLENWRLERWEYDWSEWREYKERPSIPKECI